MRSLMRGGGVCLLHWQIAVVSRSVQALGIGATACEVFLQNNKEMSMSKTDKRMADSNEIEKVIYGGFFSPC